ncbi:MAG: hypothetical protein QW803_13140 [Candidatus Methanomethylicia archaeon]
MEIRIRLRTLNTIFTFLILILIISSIAFYLINAGRIFTLILIYTCLLLVIVVILNVGYKVGFDIFKNYFKANWGAPFIIAFMILLLVAAGYLAYGLERVANDLAIYAYYALVLGVVLQFICYIKYGGGQNG